MFPIIIRNSRVPRLFNCIGGKMFSIIIFPFIFIIKESDIDDDEYTFKRVINHEMIHYKQFIELFVIGFYLVYFYDFIKNLIIYKDILISYQNIRLEKEAYKYDNQMDYLEHRKHYQWLYI